MLVLSIFIAQEPQMADFVKVANTNEIEPGQARLAEPLRRRAEFAEAELMNVWARGQPTTGYGTR